MASEWDNWKGFETLGSLNDREQFRGIQRNSQGDYVVQTPNYEGGSPYETVIGLDAYQEMADRLDSPANYEGQLFGEFARRLGMTPSEAKAKYDEIINSVGGITNPGLRMYYPVDALISQYGAQIPQAAKDWWYSPESGRDRMVQMGEKYPGRGGSFIQKAMPALSVLLGPVFAWAGGAAGPMMNAFADAGTMGLYGAGPLSSVSAGLGTAAGAGAGTASALSGADFWQGAGAGLGAEPGAGFSLGSSGVQPTAQGLSLEGGGLGLQAPSSGFWGGSGLGYLDALPAYAPANYSLNSGGSFGGEGFRPGGGEGLMPSNSPNLNTMGGGQGLTGTVPGGTISEAGVSPTSYAADSLGATASSSQTFGDFLRGGKQVLDVAKKAIQAGGSDDSSGGGIQPTTSTAGATTGPVQPTSGGVETAVTQGYGTRYSPLYGPLTADVDRELAQQDEYYATGGDETYGGEDIEQQPAGIEPTTQAYASGGRVQPGLAPTTIPAANPSSQFGPMQRPQQGDRMQMMKMKLDNMARMNPAMVSAMTAQAQQAGMTPAIAQQIWMLSAAALQNPQMYPQIRQYAMQGLKISPNTLPEQFDPGRISTLAGIAHIVSNGKVPTVPVPPTGYSRGGRITGPGDGDDDAIEGVNESTGEPVRVSNGEYIVSSDVVEALGTEYFDKLQRKYHRPNGYRPRQ